MVWVHDPKRVQMLPIRELGSGMGSICTIVPLCCSAWVHPGPYVFDFTLYTSQPLGRQAAVALTWETGGTPPT